MQLHFNWENKDLYRTVIQLDSKRIINLMDYNPWATKNIFES